MNIEFLIASITGWLIGSFPLMISSLKEKWKIVFEAFIIAVAIAFVGSVMYG